MDDRISIIVSTFNRKTQLNRLLESFTQLNCCCPLEFIIVDNCSDDGTRAIVENWKKIIDFADVKYHILPERAPLAHSRNVGISLSTGNIIAFTDDDCRVDPAWLNRLYQRLITCSDYAGVGGRVLPVGDDIYSVYNTVYRVLEPPPHTKVVIGANCMFWKQPVIDAGLFDEYFIVLGGEEIALCMKLGIRGYRFGFEERGIVYHDYRKTLNAFIRTFFNYGTGEKIMIENQLSEYLQYMDYPEKMFNSVAFNHNLKFQVLFIIGIIVHILKQISFLRQMSLTHKTRIQLLGLCALHHFCYNIGRETFSGKLSKTVDKYLANRPDLLLTIDPDADSITPFLKITHDTIPSVLKPGTTIVTSITIKNPSHERFISTGFLVTLENGENHSLFYKTPKPQNMVFFPMTEMVYTFSLTSPFHEQKIPLILVITTQHGALLSDKREKLIMITSE
jgi:glycosyltransferase involved in cell wall biosynthesis